MIDFLLDEHELKKCEKLFQNIVFFCMLSCQNTVNTTAFGWFALRTGSENMKKTVVFAVHLKPPVEKTSQNTVFSTWSLKNSVNSDVFGRFSSLTLQNRRKFQCFFFYKDKNHAKYSVFGRFWPKMFDQEPQQQQQQQQQQQEEHMTPCKLGAGGPCRGAAWINIFRKNDDICWLMTANTWCFSTQCWILCDYEFHFPNLLSQRCARVLWKQKNITHQQKTLKYTKRLP